MAPLAPLFMVLNWVAFVGWTYVLCQLLFSLRIPAMIRRGNGDDDGSALSSSSSSSLIQLQPIVFGLECICLIEVLRIVVRDLPGNVVLGVVLHAIRFTVLTVVLPQLQQDESIDDTFLSRAIFVSWSVTEVSRYPMYMFPGNDAPRNIRMVVPLLTFPLGAAAEAYATFTVWKLQQQSSRPAGAQLPFWQHALLLAVLFVNSVLGPTMAYPALLKKGLPVLGMAKQQMSTKKKKE